MVHRRDLTSLIGLCAGGFNASCQLAVGTTLATFESNLTATLGQLRAAAGPDVPIAVMRPGVTEAIEVPQGPRQDSRVSFWRGPA